MSRESLEIMNAKATVKRTYKDTVFRMLFSERTALLALYNAINNKHYVDPNELTITTLENAIYMSIKNDISCVIDMRLNMYEHQSTVNPNIPLRDLDYVSRTYSALYKNMDVYSTKAIHLPNPKFVVFYNGITAQPPIRYLKLSDLYVHKEINPCLELVVMQININPGYNEDLMEKCKLLKEYMQYVERVRTYQNYMRLEDAVNRAVDECIKDGILVDFLKKNKAEVISMSLFEYDEKLHEKTLLEIGREEGLQKGMRGAVAILKSFECSDNEILEKIMKEYQLSPDEAKAFLE